jgi:hypothetical protein
MIRLICSEEACAKEALAEAETLDKLEALACDCGCALAVIGWPDHRDDPVTQAPMMVSFGPSAALSDLAA